MTQTLYIQNYVRIKNSRLNINGSLKAFEIASAKAFAEQIYRSESLAYPKFFKMDLLSKFGFLAAELLLKNSEKPSDTSLVFANKSSSLDTDIKHQQSIEAGKNFLPSPATFVYTLPNIVMGEICIRHQFKGENIFIVQPQFSPKILTETINLQLSLGKATNFILAWVEVLHEEIDIFACLINAKQNEETKTFTTENLTHLYNT